MDRVEFRLLGPMAVIADGSPVPLPNAAERALLALLLLSPGRAVPAATLIDRLWGEERLPVDPVNALQIRVSKLRRALTAADVDITRDVAGYRADIDPNAVDVHRFSADVRAARKTAAGSRTPAVEALQGYDDALGLWGGEPLADFPDEPWAEVEKARLVQLRMAALTERSELALRLGRHDDVVADLEPIVAEDPKQERLVALLMTGLYGSGRQADALRAYQRTRSALRDELGLEPSAALRSLQQQVLRQRVLQQEELAAPPLPVAPAASERADASELLPDTGHRRAGTPLPAAVRPLIGREPDLDCVRQLLGSSRLVNLIGPGGAGKTALAFAAARAVETDYPDGVWVAHLASVREPGEVALAVADALAVPLDGATSGGDPRGRVVSYLGRRRVLLVLDNCEHVVDAAARLVDAVLAGCPDVRILATSREALAVPGEVQLAVAPLDSPPSPTPTEQILTYPAAQLFAQRAADAGVRVSQARADLDAVARICRQLDGIPLALELAAARLSTLSAVELADRLGDRFALLTGGARTADARQRTLRATVDWSHALLTVDEQALFRRLAIFQGGWTLAAAEAVTADDGVPVREVLDLLSRLVARSLVIAEPGRPTRFRMLDTLRYYAGERLQASGEQSGLAARHAAYFTDLAEHAELAYRGGLSRDTLHTLRDEQPNLRAALSWLTGEPSRIDQALILAGALGWFWHLGRHLEGGQVLSGLLDSGGGSAAARARALQAASLVERPRGCLVHPSPRCADTARRSLLLFDQAGDAHRAALSRILLAVEGVNGSRAAESEALLQQAEQVFTAEQDRWGHAVIALVRMETYLKAGDATRAQQIGRAGVDAFRELDDPWGLSAMLYHLGWGLRQFGRYAEAIAVLEEAIEVALSAGLFNTAQWALADKGVALLLLGQFDAAGDAFDQASAASADVGDAAGDVLASYGFGLSARLTGDWEQARDRFTTAAAGFERLGTPVMVGQALAGIARCDEQDGAFDQARQRHERVLGIGESAQEPALVAAALEGLARLRAKTGAPAEAAAMLERAGAIRVRANRPSATHERADLAAGTGTATG